MEYKFFNNGAYNIHVIKTDKFKNIKFNVYFRNNLNKENYIKREFLFDLLVDSCKDYPTKRDLILKCENLYNATLYSASEKEGGMIFNSICLDILNPNLTKEDYLEDGIELLFDVIFNPNISNNEFEIKSFNKIMKFFKNDLKLIKERPASLAIKNAFSYIDSLSSLSFLGNEESFDLITPSNIYETYLDILKHDYIDIFVIGDVDINRCVDLINKYAKFNTIKTHSVDLYINNKLKLILKNDVGVYNQSQVVFILNYDLKSDFEKRYVANLFNVILGGPNLDSKLYKILRDENSLCYSIRSYYKRFDNLGYIVTSVSNNNKEKAIKLIKKALKEMENLTNDDLENAKLTIKSSLTAGLDNSDSIIDTYFFNYLNELDLFDERVKLFNKVTLSDIKRLSKRVSIGIIYTLGGKNEEI